jgi:hypothetical protein
MLPPRGKSKRFFRNRAPFCDAVRFIGQKTRDNGTITRKEDDDMSFGALFFLLVGIGYATARIMRFILWLDTPRRGGAKK